MPVDKQELTEEQTEYLTRSLATMSALHAIVETRFGSPRFDGAKERMNQIMKEHRIDWGDSHTFTKCEMLKVIRSVASGIASECEEALNE